MNRPLHRLIVWTMLANVGVVGVLGTGLHDLLGCSHSCRGTTGASCCGAEAVCSDACADCVFCQRAKEASSPSDNPELSATGCEGCAVCDLLAQYHSVVPHGLEPLSTELAVGEAACLRQNAIVAAMVRQTLSRGPPAA